MSERLFLLEVYIENLHVDNCKNLGTFKQTCVFFKFLNYPFLEILEDEQCRELSPDDQCDIKFQTGKSCLFALRGPASSLDRPPLDLDVAVAIKTSEQEPSKPFGRTKVSLGDSFTNIVNLVKQNDVFTQPLTKTSKEEYALKNSQGKAVGTIGIFTRLSCFGRIIVTQFQMSGQEQKSFLFKAVSDVQCKVFEAGDMKEGERPCGEPSVSTSALSNAPAGGQMGMPYQGGMMGYPGAMPYPYPGMMPPQMGGFGGMWPPQRDAAPQVDYKSMSANVGGHNLEIKVLRKQRKLKPPEPLFCQRFMSSSSSSSSDESDTEDQSKAQKTEPGGKCPLNLRPVGPKMPFCDCDIPIPPGVVPPPPSPPPPPPKKTKKPKCPEAKEKKMDMCRAPTCPMGFPMMNSGGGFRPPFNEPGGFGGGVTMPNPYTSAGYPGLLGGGGPTASSMPMMISVRPPEIPLGRTSNRCLTVRDTQYKDSDAKGGKAKEGKNGDKKKGGAEGKKKKK